MSRFGTYLAAQKLAKAHLLTAEDRLRRGDVPAKVLEPLIAAVRELTLAANNLASMQFEPKRKIGGSR
jgi:hypothetical protein